MSKTIIIMDAPDNASGIDMVGDDNLYFLGAFGEVITALKQAFPKGDFSEPTDIKVDTEMGLISIEISKHTPVQSFMMHLENPEALPLVQKLCARTNWRGLDTDTGQFIDIKSIGANSVENNKTRSWWKLWKK